MNPNYEQERPWVSNFGQEIADLALQEGMKNPMGSLLHDEEIARRRSRLEKQLPKEPGSGVNLLDAINEKAVAAGAIRTKRQPGARND